jgi:hypothetical protein
MRMMRKTQHKLWRNKDSITNDKTESRNLSEPGGDEGDGRQNNGAALDAV